MMSKELQTGMDVVKQYLLPRLYNLNLDPKEEHPLTYAPEHYWVRFPIGKLMTDYAASLAKYPPIPPGAPDPYTPPVAPANSK